MHVSRDSVRAACVTTFVPSPKEEISQRDSEISYRQCARDVALRHIPADDSRRGSHPISAPSPNHGPLQPDAQL